MMDDAAARRHEWRLQQGRHRARRAQGRAVLQVSPRRAALVAHLVRRGLLRADEKPTAAQLNALCTWLLDHLTAPDGMSGADGASPSE